MGGCFHGSSNIFSKNFQKSTIKTLQHDQPITKNFFKKSANSPTPIDKHGKASYNQHNHHWRSTMATLTAKQRKALPATKFGMPESKGYPMPDKSHAANAKARATQMVKKGKLAPGTAAQIKAKANKVLGSK
jgi:hypothetical protein